MGISFPRTEQLLRYLEEFCKRGRGQQKKAAIYCHCSASTVCDWLHGRKKPTGEQALALHDLLYSGDATKYWRPRLGKRCQLKRTPSDENR